MFIKKSVVLSPEKGFFITALQISKSNGSIMLSAQIDGEALIMANDKTAFGSFEKGLCRLDIITSSPFAIGVFQNGKLTHFYKEEACAFSKYDIQKSYKKILAERSKKIKQTYDDEQIAQENYYEKHLKKAPILPIMREKGDLSISLENAQNQNSTIFPQCVNMAEDQENYAKQAKFIEDDIPCKENKEQEKNEDFKRETIDAFFSDKQNEEQGYYSKIESELDALFIKFPRVIELERIVSGSKFVKIVYSDDKYYVVGRTFYNSMPEYIIFGIPASGSLPDEMKDFAFFAPCKNSGYYLIYQSAKDGKILRKGLG